MERMYNKARIGGQFKTFFDIVLPENLKNAHFAVVLKDFVLREPGYFNKLPKLLAKTENRTIHNYVLWRFAEEWSKLCGSTYDNIRQNFMRALIGLRKKRPKTQQCARSSVLSMPMATGSLCVRKHFNANEKTEALKMIEHLRKAFVDNLLQNLAWMDKTTKTAANEKAEAMTNQIGYPDFIMNNYNLDKHYKNLNLLESDSYFDMVRKQRTWKDGRNWEKLLKPVDKTEFDTSPAVVNAYHKYEKNAIVFPAGIIRPPFFHGDYPKSVNYAGIGAIIGHEITHGFDDKGRQYNKDGGLHDWWSDVSLTKFQDKSMCMVKQYSGYEMPGTGGMKLNGQMTLGENIADNGGLKIAYQAYKDYVKDHGKEPSIDGLTSFTNEQIFFLTYAQNWCETSMPQYDKMRVNTGLHSPGRFRVFGPLANFGEFAKAFSCKPSSPLNPPKTDHSKCSVW